MTMAKNLEQFALMAKIESTYGTPVAGVTTTDGLVVADLPTYDEKQLYDGENMSQAAGLNRMQQLPVSGRYYEVNGVVWQIKGAGAAYSASVLPQGLAAMALCRAAGFTQTLTTTPGTEKVEMDPTAPNAAMGSASLELYERGEAVKLTGCYGDLEINLRNGGPGLITWNGVGILSAQPADAALPTLTYLQTTVLPPNAHGIGLNIGSFTAPIIREVGLKFGRKFNEMRPNLNAGTAPGAGIAGAMWGEFDPTLHIVAEATALVGTPYHTASGFDPYRLAADSVNFGCGFTIGSTQYNRFKVTFANGIYIKPGTVKKTRAGAGATVEFDAVPRGVSPTDMSWCKLTWD